MRRALYFLLCLAAPGRGGDSSWFEPKHQVSGIGAARPEMSDDLLQVRTDLMIRSQTFGIMRDPAAAPGAKRVTGKQLQAVFRKAAQSSGLPVSMIEAVAYLESWGEAKAESPAGPKGIMQISEATARRMGLRIVRATRYRVSTERVAVKRKGKTTYRTVKRKTPYSATVRDDRMLPERAVPAAATYLAGLERRFGGRDWAVFAYHCGEGCAAEVRDLARQARGIPAADLTVARTFFSASPAYNRDLYQALRKHMLRDYSPTYWFRVRRAEQLLALYRRDPAEFVRLAGEFRSQSHNGPRAPHRLSVWLRKEDLVFRSCEEMRLDAGKRLARAMERPGYFGYTLAPAIGLDDPSNRELYLQASPAALGTLAYIAFETRRLHEAVKPRGERFHPLEVTSLVQPAERAGRPGSDAKMAAEALSHCTGQVFDIDLARMPPGQRECLRFVLDDLGWNGYLGFVEEGAENLHIGCSPSSRDFFATVFQETLEAAGAAGGL